MNIISNSKWITCRKPENAACIDIKNPWEGLNHGTRPFNLEKQFQPIINQGGCAMFRKSFVCNKNDHVKITATSLGIYTLWCNGRRIGTMDQKGNLVYDEFNPGFTVYSKRVMASEYDLSDYIIDGENIVLAVVSSGWWSGKVAYKTYGADLPLAFCAEISVNSESIITDSSWSCQWGGRIRAADFYDGEIYNANYPSYEEMSANQHDSSDWSNSWELTDYIIEAAEIPNMFPHLKCHISSLEVVPFIGPPVRINHDLSRNPVSLTIYDGFIENGSDYGKINITRQPKGSEKISLKKGECLIIDFGQEIVGFPSISLKASKGTYVQIKVAEMLNDSGLISRGNDNPEGSLYTINYRDARSKAYYVANGNDENENYCPTFSFFGFRYIEISATDDVDIIDVTALVVGSELEEIGHIETSNNEVNKLISNVVWGQRSNYLSIPTDCPQRDERQGWTGDTQFFCNTAAYNANVLDFFRKWLTDARDSQWSGGWYHDVVPMIKNYSRASSAWTDCPVIVTHVMWRMYGDIDIIKENIDSLEKYMKWLEGRGMSGAEDRYGDWLAYEAINTSFVSKTYYAWDAQMMSELHKVIGNHQRSEEYDALYMRIKDHLRTTFMDGEGDLLPEFRTQTGYLLALHVGMFNENEISNAADALERKIVENGYKLSTGFVGTAILCKTLARFGKNNIAYSLLLQTEDPSWIYSIRQGATTIWERWNSYTLEKGFGDVRMNSFNHYSFGAVMEWMYRFMVGIEVDPSAPAFERVILQPKPDLRAENEIPDGQERISWVKGEYKSVKGLIKSEWTYENKSYKYNFETPVSAQIYIPITSDDPYITLNGKCLSLSDLQILDNCFVTDVEKGAYTVEVK